MELIIYFKTLLENKCAFSLYLMAFHQINNYFAYLCGAISLLQTTSQSAVTNGGVPVCLNHAPELKIP